jgi:hypothetical protein
MVVNANSLGYQNPSNQQIPQEGPVCVPYLLDFSGSTTEYDFDFTLPVETGKISQINTLYVDASAATDDVVCVVQQVNQTLIFKAGTQGYYPVLASNPPKFVFTSAANNAVVPVFFLNVPLSGVIWTT